MSVIFNYRILRQMFALETIRFTLYSTMLNLINFIMLKDSNNNNYKTLNNWADVNIREKLSGKTKILNWPRGSSYQIIG